MLAGSFEWGQSAQMGGIRKINVADISLENMITARALGIFVVIKHHSRPAALSTQRERRTGPGAC
jgi:hypothetical protein